MVDDQFFAELALHLGVPVEQWDSEDPKELVQAAIDVYWNKLTAANPELNLKPATNVTPNIDKFWWYVKQLKKDFPPSAPISVKTKPFGQLRYGGRRCYGLCHWPTATRGYQISIERHSDVEIMLDTLFHEWTHALVGYTDRLEHPVSKFWRTYGKLYNFYEDAVKKS